MEEGKTKERRGSKEGGREKQMEGGRGNKGIKKMERKDR